jgi:hypothetical protein
VWSACVSFSGAGRPGEQVRAGQQVMLIESMKMHHAIEADASGAIDALLVEVGQTVAEGEPVAMLAPGEVTVAEVVEAVDDEPDRIRPDLAETLARHRFGHDDARPDAEARRRAVGRRTARENVADLVDPGSRLAIVRARVGDLGSRRLEGIYDRIDAALAGLEREQPGWRFRLAGMSVVSARNIRQLVRDLGSSLVVEVLVIGGILAIAFRSPLAGIVSLIPNVFPLTVIASILVATGRALDPATVIVFNVCLGLAVDDTVHVLSALARHRSDGKSVASAVRRAVAETGNAVVIGGVVLTVGFAAVTASSVPALAGFGVLACAAVAAATLAELVFLPALLVVTDGVVQRRWPVLRDGIFGARRLALPAEVPA